MRSDYIRVTIFILLLLVITNLLLYADPNYRPQNYEILFIGSSYFNFNNLPALFDSLATAAEHDVFFDQSISNGLYLADHVDRPQTIEKIYQQDWDYVILQGVGSLMAYPDYYTENPVYPALVALRDMILENCPTTKIIFCMPWAFEDGMTWVPGWTDTYLDMQQHIYDNTLAYSAEIGFEISPVGWAWRTVLMEQDFPLHYLHMSDWNHPTLRGSYLMACVIFSHVYLESAAGLEHEVDLTPQEISYFQTIGSNTVLDNLDLWNISTTYSEQEEFPDNSIIELKNYPNPFNPTTTIYFSYNHPSSLNHTSVVSYAGQAEDTELCIYNIKGQKIKTFTFPSGSCRIGTSEYLPFSHSPDHSLYEVTWNGTDEAGNKVPSGIYLSKLTYGNKQATRKLLLMK